MFSILEQYHFVDVNVRNMGFQDEILVYPL